MNTTSRSYQSQGDVMKAKLCIRTENSRYLLNEGLFFIKLQMAALILFP
jgi:hypothetical protein